MLMNSTGVALPLKFRTRPAGFAFVGFKIEEDAKKAVEELDGIGTILHLFLLDRAYDVAMGERKLALQMARSKEEVAERRQEAQARRDAARAQRVEDGEGDVNGEKPRRAARVCRIDRCPGSKADEQRPGRRRVAEEGEEEGTTAVETDEGTEGKALSKRKPRARKPREARIDEEGFNGDAPAKTRAPKERKPRLELTGEQSKVGHLLEKHHGVSAEPRPPSSSPICRSTWTTKPWLRSSRIFRFGSSPPPSSPVFAVSAQALDRSAAPKDLALSRSKIRLSRLRLSRKSKDQ